MPELSRFFGIIIRMFVEAGGKHDRPHFHAYYQEHAAIVGIDIVELIAGAFPVRQKRLVLAWAEIHRRELEDAWRSLQQNRPPSKIEPLR